MFRFLKLKIETARAYLAATKVLRKLAKPANFIRFICFKGALKRDGCCALRMSETFESCPLVADISPLPIPPPIAEKKKSHRSPHSVADVESAPKMFAKPGNIQVTDDYDIDKKSLKVSPTTRFIQTNGFRSHSPTDRMRKSPNVIMRKRYANNNMDEESERAAFAAHSSD